MKRETGYYWVKYYGNWSVAFYNPEHDLFVWNDDSAYSVHVEINEQRILSPDEKRAIDTFEGHIADGKGKIILLTYPDPNMEKERDKIVITGISNFDATAYINEKPKGQPYNE